MNTRRHFIQRLTASFIALPLLKTNTVAAFDNINKELYDGPVLRVAIMGLGSYGSRVADAIQSCTRVKLVGVISGTPSKIKTWQEKYQIPEKNCYNYENFDAIKNNQDIDAVYIITPNALHKSQTIRVAKAGKHVICEKPMALNAKEATEMIAACKAANVKLLIGYRMHFEPKTLEVIRQRQAGQFGKIKFFQGLSGFKIGDPTQWRLNKALSGGGSLMDIGIYSLNAARYMVGEEPIWVTAQETKTDTEKFKEGVDETITFQLGFPGGATASCLSTYAMNYLDRFHLVGETGFAELSPAHGYGPIMGRTSAGELNQPHKTHQTVQMDEMAAMILENKQSILPVDGAEGLRDLKIIDAIYSSLKSGRRINLST
ncbi:MAG: Gfo/Idh/MocA family oxidoreductase [Ferruginibacter sp.]